jgi:hypothetical protein
MIRDLGDGEVGKEGIIDFPLFNVEIAIEIEEDTPIDYAEKCADALFRLEDAEIERFCDGAIRYCERMREYFNEMDVSMPANLSGREILAYIQPCSIYIVPPKSDGVAFLLSCNCDWEVEHGLECIIKDGKVIYMGSFISTDPWLGEEFLSREYGNYIDTSGF